MPNNPNPNQNEALKDPRWSIYRERFHSMPLFCFNDLKYPDSYEEAVSKMKVLEIEQTNIEKQFAERELELTTTPAEMLESATQELNKWKTKALRAQRLKFNQVRLLEAWMLESPPTHEERIRLLEERTKRLEERLDPKD